ncbi:glucose-1-phosphate thymidylyltransferase [bacterium]|nr:glucose-1-phosphate thymidylyltransferase [bacterium]
MPISCVLFEDSFADRLRPINLARPSCSVTCGGTNLQKLVEGYGWKVQYFVRPHLRGVMERDGRPLAAEITGPILYLNASLVPDPASLRRIQELVEKEETFLALNDQRVTAAYVREEFPSHLATRDASELVSYLLDRRLSMLTDEFPTLEHTFDVVRHHGRLLPIHLAWQIEKGAGKELTKDVYLGDGCEIANHVEFDVSQGPIVIGRGVRIKPFSYIAGPVQIGDKSLIIDHASIKHGTVLGHTVKAGGEIEESVIEPYSNKQHHGFLGHAYVGSWVNLGAGTSNSDLKNTYGEISIDWEGRSKNTGLQFLGCVIGDYTKTAINTSIFTGKLIGVASFLYGFISTNVPSFTNYARSFGQVTEVGVDVAIKAQTRAAARRNVQMAPVDTLLMQELFDMTRSERQLSSEQVVL